MSKKKENLVERSTRWLLKRSVMDAYGGKCVCCGESHIVFLDLDHIYNDGAEDRKTNRGGNSLYRKLRQNGYPQDAGFQILCRNCNWGKYINGGSCPHRSDVCLSGVVAPTAQGKAARFLTVNDMLRDLLAEIDKAEGTDKLKFIDGVLAVLKAQKELE